ncbi:phosphotransferase family protein [Micromonospora sp. NPDC050417]|uniref:phosphotransferase family protein n=1 Tax=Micromonospora sp. NPDC050417 TaxID=3364280 RepID=UPI00378DA4F5
MLTPPGDISEDVLVAALHRAWGLTVASLTYRPVGWGSHHWEVVDTGGGRWFLSLDELEIKRHSRTESLDGAFGRLRAALDAARALRQQGTSIVVAPVSTSDNESLTRLSERFSLALYPHVDGESFAWGDYSAPGHRAALLDLVVAVHAAPEAVRGHAMADDFAVPHRDELEAGLRSGDDVEDCGPYARPSATLVAAHASPLRRLLGHYDDLVVAARAQPSRAVLTHGEPHSGNSMLTAEGWRLIDWETALLAPPERDLWNLDPGDGSILRAYAEATGVTALPRMLELYRIRWDITDLAVDVDRFRRPHSGNADDKQSWELLNRLVAHLST